MATETQEVPIIIYPSLIDPNASIACRPLAQTTIHEEALPQAHIAMLIHILMLFMTSKNDLPYRGVELTTF
jgi:hypothetical protein